MIADVEAFLSGGLWMVCAGHCGSAMIGPGASLP
jgi:hypothetical protein